MVSRSMRQVLLGLSDLVPGGCRTRREIAAKVVSLGERVAMHATGPRLVGEKLTYETALANGWIIEVNCWMDGIEAPLVAYAITDKGREVLESCPEHVE